MAQKVRVEYFDDIDGQPITDGLAQSFRITVDDVEYELDLRPANADKFLAVLQPWLTEKNPARNGSAAAPDTRKTTPARRRSVRSHKTIPPTRSPEQLAAIRHWARNKGYDVSSRGRIPRDIVERFEAAHA